MAHKTWRFDEESASFAYDLMSSLVVPRPIAFVSTVGSDGTPNLAPFSFFMVGGPNPPSLVFCPVLNKRGEKKTTLINVEQTGEFVVNLVTRRLAGGMNETSGDYLDSVSKWGLSGFTSETSLLVAPDRVAESPVQFECRVHQIVNFGDSSYVIGEVLAAHLEESVLDAGTGKVTGFRPIARLGGAEYIDLDGGKVFEMARPKPMTNPSVDL
ncbi:MAG: flavin reductase family protein [Armatimonadetes bacterium]|nr:flavin reductase family protein [Armatimonadota bacterium]